MAKLVDLVDLYWYNLQSIIYLLLTIENLLIILSSFSMEVKVKGSKSVCFYYATIFMRQVYHNLKNTKVTCRWIYAHDYIIHVFNSTILMTLTRS